MQVTTEQINPCKVALTITVESEKVTAAKEKAFLKFAKNVQLPGFRKGKAPLSMARAYVDPARIAQEAVSGLSDPSFKEAIEQTGIEPFAQAELEFVSMDEGGPFVFRAYVPLRPVVTLGPYKALAIEKRRLIVSADDVEQQIDELRTRFAEYPEVADRGAATGDVALADLMAFVDGQETPDLAVPRTTVIEIGKNIADFDNGLVGMTVGETKTIDALYPEDFADEKLRGKRAMFTVSIKELREKKLPELNEEFVTKVHPTAKNADEFRSALSEALDKAAEQMADNELEFRLISQIARNSQINFPDVLLRAEMQVDARQLDEQIKRSNLTIDQYLQQQGKTRDEVGREMALSAAQRIRNSLVLAEVARAESITIEDADIEARIAEEAERRKTSVPAMRAFLEKNNQMTSIQDQALTRKILAFLKEASIVTERQLTSDEAEALEAEEEAEAAADTANAAAAAGISIQQATEAGAIAAAEEGVDLAPDEAVLDPVPVAATVSKRRSKKVVDAEVVETAAAEPETAEAA